ncbi:PEGA domain-containing protein [Alcaligenes nematophilus]
MFFPASAACSCIAVTYPGDPEGATVVCNGSAYGETPLIINGLLEGASKC